MCAFYKAGSKFTGKSCINYPRGNGQSNRCQAPVQKARGSTWDQMSPDRLDLVLDQKNIIARWRLCHMMEIPTLTRGMAAVRTSLETVTVCLCHTTKDPIWKSKYYHPVCMRKTQSKHLSILLRCNRVWNTDCTLMLHTGTPLNTMSLRLP